MRSGASVQFTGKERDGESGLDNFGARYNSSWMGRFMTPDDFWKDSHVGDPQSWNKYAYVRNNPLRYVDPTGEKATVSTKCTTDEDDKQTCNVTISASI
jgi:RHS repeat-associated protein